MSIVDKYLIRDDNNDASNVSSGRPFRVVGKEIRDDQFLYDFFENAGIELNFAGYIEQSKFTFQNYPDTTIEKIGIVDDLAIHILNPILGVHYENYLKDSISRYLKLNRFINREFFIYSVSVISYEVREGADNLNDISSFTLTCKCSHSTYLPVAYLYLKVSFEQEKSYYEDLNLSDSNIVIVQDFDHLESYFIDFIHMHKKEFCNKLDIGLDTKNEDIYTLFSMLNI